MSLVFTPPTVFDVPRVVPWPHEGNALFKFYSPLERGVSVFLLDDGTFTETQPANDEGVAHTYHGGHEHPVTEAEAEALTSAGYGAYITEAEA